MATGERFIPGRGNETLDRIRNRPVARLEPTSYISPA
jgi:hypothetical protein